MATVALLARPRSSDLPSAEIFFAGQRGPTGTVVLEMHTNLIPTTPGGLHDATFENEGRRLGLWLKAFASPAFLQSLVSSCT